MRMRAFVATSLLAATLAVSSTAAQASVTFTDGTFSPLDYQLGFAASGGTATVTMQQCATCGDPGTALRLTIFDVDGSNLGAAFINTTFTYDPLTQGAINTIDAFANKNFSITAPTGFSYGNTFRPIIEQGGNFYTAVQFSPTSGAGQTGMTTSTGYLDFALSNLTALDFNKFDTTTGTIGTDHPDFAGSTIRFGLGQVIAASPASVGVPVTVTSDFDNVSFNIVSAVPEPATWALLVGGFGMVGGVARRRPRGVIATA